MPPGDGHALTLVATAVTARRRRPARPAAGQPGRRGRCAPATAGGSTTTPRSAPPAARAHRDGLAGRAELAADRARRHGDRAGRRRARRARGVPTAAAARSAAAPSPALDALFMLPLGVSAVTVGFGFLLSMHHPFGLPVDLRTSPLLVPDRAGGGRRAARRADGAAGAARDRPAAAGGRRDARRRARPRAADRGPVDRRAGRSGSPSGSRSPRRSGSSARRRSSPAPTGRRCPS